MCEHCGCGHSDHEHIHIMLPAKGLTDEASAAKLAEALNSLPGVHATADHNIGAVSLLLHDEADIAAAKELIEKLGADK